MEFKAKYRYPVALTIAGSDSSGGAGIQADLKTFSATGVYGMSAITSITAQNTMGVRGIQPVAPEILKGQLEAVFEDSTIDAVKTGMLHNKKAVEIIAEVLDKFSSGYLVVDPVMISTSGSKLIEDDAVEAIIRLLFCRSTLITPNLSEAEFLTGLPVRNEEEMEKAGRKLLGTGCNAVLMKGGHLDSEEMTDILLSRDAPPVYYRSKRIDTMNTHGTGCTFSSAITACLALGESLPDAVKLAKEYITGAMHSGSDVHAGNGHGPVNHFFNPKPLRKINL